MGYLLGILTFAVILFFILYIAFGDYYFLKSKKS